MRPDWHEWWMEQALVQAKRATCLRRQVGAIAVYQNELVSSGYNGAPSRCPHCIERGCLVIDNHCVRCLHAEANALRRAKGQPIDTLYCTLEPCWRCVQAAVAHGVRKIYYHEPYPCAVQAAMLADYERLGMVEKL